MDRRTLMSAPPASSLAPSAGGLGERVRRLRNERGLTQTELAAARVSKEYISQIETGKTRPTQQTLDWLAERLGVDPHYLVDGVSDRDHREHEAIVVQAEEAVQEKRYRDAVEAIESLPRTPGSPELHLRALFAESWARMYLGELRTALDRLERARAAAAGDTFGDVDRAQVLYRLGCCHYKLTHVDRALKDFTAALEFVDHSGESCDRLRANILQWRSRCYRRHRDWEAAREDIERALELAEAVGDNQTVAPPPLPAPPVARRDRQRPRARRRSPRRCALPPGRRCSSGLDSLGEGGEHHAAETGPPRRRRCSRARARRDCEREAVPEEPALRQRLRVRARVRRRQLGPIAGGGAAATLAPPCLIGGSRTSSRRLPRTPATRSPSASSCSRRSRVRTCTSTRRSGTAPSAVPCCSSRRAATRIAAPASTAGPCLHSPPTSTIRAGARRFLPGSPASPAMPKDCRTLARRCTRAPTPRRLPGARTTALSSP